PVLGHHATGLGVDLAAPVVDGPLDLEAEAPPGRVEDTHALGHHFLADAVAGNGCDAMFHARLQAEKIRGALAALAFALLLLPAHRDREGGDLVEVAIRSTQPQL